MPKKHFRLTPERHSLIINAIRAGVPRSVAVRAARVDRMTVSRWLAKGEKIAGRTPKNDEEQKLLSFYQDYVAADSECERWLITKLARAVESGDLPTVRWMLERRFSKRWLPRQQVGVSQDANDETTPVEIEFILATPKPPKPADDFDTEDKS